METADPTGAARVAAEARQLSCRQEPLPRALREVIHSPTGVRARRPESPAPGQAEHLG
jgi:hypothetical protein